MRFSVVIPVHNAASFLGAALASVAAQTLPPHEVILVDDGSTDGSMDIARTFAASGALAAGVAVKLLSSDARNAAATRNVGIRAAGGDWIALLDADDLWEPRHLEWSGEVLAKAEAQASAEGGPQPVAMMSNHLWLTEQDGRQPIPEGLRPKLGGTLAGLPPARFVEELARQLHFGHSTVVYRRDRLLEVGAFDPAQKRRHDIELWLRALAGHAWCWDERLHAVYRVDTPGSISKAVVECEIYYLCALLRHRAAYASPAMEHLLATHARRAMSLSFVDGTAAQFAEARAIASPLVPAKFRLAWRLAGVCPGLLRRAIRLKRKWVWRKDGAGAAATSSASPPR